MPAQDFVMEASLGHYKQPKADLVKYREASARHDVLVSFKVLADTLESYWSDHAADWNIDGSLRMDWIREAMMACIELGVALIYENVLRLLSDQAYFESLLPIPIDSQEWGGASGTEIVRQWWLLASDGYRRCHLQGFRQMYGSIDFEEVQYHIVVHPDSGNRGFAQKSALTYPHEKCK